MALPAPSTFASTEKMYSPPSLHRDQIRSVDPDELLIAVVDDEDLAIRMFRDPGQNNGLCPSIELAFARRHPSGKAPGEPLNSALANRFSSNEGAA